ncbi:MAG: DUF3168 domain-containing protein [Rhizobiales bacterium]|nr:DUF3168 domain-containing protein [Hyphomicrobiales bacterium]OJY06361.1 MAG: hypothetical protein BGP07_14780 [Rhizobiales bacterium 63-22]
MTGSAAALQKGLFEALRDDAELAVLLGGKRIHDRVPPKTPFPYVTLGETVSRDWSTATEAGAEHFLNILIWARDSGRGRVLDIAGRIAVILGDGLPLLDGHRLVNLALNEVLARDTDGRGSCLGTMRYRAVTEPE